MRTSWGVLFLITAAAGMLHLAEWKFFVVFVGYWSLDSLDRWLAKKAKAKAIGRAIDDVLFGWETDPKNPEWEEKDEWSRVKLTGKDQIIVARVADLLRGTLQ